MNRNQEMFELKWTPSFRLRQKRHERTAVSGDVSSEHAPGREPYVGYREREQFGDGPTERLVRRP